LNSYLSSRNSQQDQRDHANSVFNQTPCTHFRKQRSKRARGWEQNHVV
jgi:hypothetical protein